MGRRRSVLGILVRVLLLALVAYLVLLVVSGLRLRDEVNKTTAAYQTYEQCVNDADFAGAVVAVKQIAASVDTINAESDQWWWQLAEHVPVLGQDVDCVRDLVDISDALANDALMPVLTKAEGLMTEGEGDFLSNLGNKADGMVELGMLVANARGVVSRCRQQADALPASHFDEVNKLTQQVREAVASVDNLFGALDSASSDVMNLVSGVIGS